MPPSTKRILILEANQDGTVGGSHQALFDLVVHLDRRRFCPVVAFYEENSFADRLRERGVEVHMIEGLEQERAVRLEGGRLQKLTDILVGAPLRRYRFLKDHEIDLLHLNNSPITAMDDWLPAAKLAGIPCVSHAVGDALLPASAKGRILLPIFDRVIAVSQHVADGMRRQGVPANRIELVHPGVDVQEFRKRRSRTPAEVRSELGVGPGQVLAVMAGNVRRWKGQHVVLDALSRVPPPTNQRIRVAFAGSVGSADEAYYRELTDAVAQHGLEDCVTFLGGRSDMPDLFAAADLAIHASQIPEPFGLVVVEALAVGTPVLAGDQGGPSEVLTPDCGISWDTGSPENLAQILEFCVANPEEVARLASNAEARADRFDAGRSVVGVERVYGQLLDLRGPTTPREIAGPIERTHRGVAL